MRKIVLLGVVAMMFVACGGPKTDKKSDDVAKVEVLSVDQFMTQADSLVGEKITVEGVADHVCKHGGKRMFILGSTPESRLKITTGEEIASFDVAYEGSKIVVTGTVDMLKMDSAYLANWEQELIDGAHETGEGEGDGHGEDDGHEHDNSSHGEQADMGEHIPGMDKVNNYKEEIKNNGKGYISIFSVVACKVEVVEGQKAPEAKEETKE